MKILGLCIIFLFISCHSNYEKDALDFIYGSIQLKYSVEKKIINNKGEVVSFSPYNYKTLYEAKDSLVSLLKNNSTFNCTYQDSEYISASYIENRIARMLQIRTASPFLKQLELEQFCEFVLPYRCDEEMFVDYDSTIIQLFKSAITDLPENTSVTEAVTAINNELKNRLKFDLRSHAMLYEPDILEVLKAGKGSCNSLTMVTTLTMRLLGIPIAIDECPVWAHRNSGHRWNAVLDTSGLWISFGGAETNPDEFDTLNDSVKAPKIFRHTYSSRKGFQPPVTIMRDMPPIFQKANRIDVTDQYVATSDVVVKLNSKSSQVGNVLYLAVFNAEKWRIVAWANLNSDSATFKNMGVNHIVYLPLFYNSGKIMPATHPFIISPDGLQVIEPDLQNEVDITLSEYNRFYDIRWNIGIPKFGWKMELFYWDKQWVSCGTCNVKKDRILRYSNVPNKGLFLIKSHDWQNTWQRIFTIENGKQIWY